jgi:hypothetical protein
MRHNHPLSTPKTVVANETKHARRRGHAVCNVDLVAYVRYRVVSVIENLEMSGDIDIIGALSCIL